MRNPLYSRYHKIKERCYNPNSKSYKRYGGRGIKMCDEWLNDYKSFETWAIANGYAPEFAIDRIDNDGDYSPENCRFVTLSENNQNRCSSRFYTYNGKTQNLTQWCTELGLNYRTVMYRMRRGWSFERSITEPVIKRNREELIDQRFGRLVVLAYAGDEFIGKDNNSKYICRCDCGNTVMVGQVKLKGGHTKSCGCLQREKATARMKNNNPMKKGKTPRDIG